MAAARRYEFAVPGMACGGCVGKIERAFAGWPQVERARANLTLKRLVIDSAGELDPEAVLAGLRALSFEAFLLDEEEAADEADRRKLRELIFALAIAGFGASNIMLLSISAWAGAEGSTRDLFHLVSALIATPVVAFAGLPFYRSALGALAAGRTNMDVPISIAVLLAYGLSLAEALAGRPETYFDAATGLLFFLLIGRTLDMRMRARARSAVVALARWEPREAWRIEADGGARPIEIGAIQPGMRLRVPAGARAPVDGVIERGEAAFDRSMVTGESAPVGLGPGDPIEAGAANLSGAIELRASKPAERSFLAEVGRMLDAAQEGRGRYVRLADRLARLYTPAVHLIAAAAFSFWILSTGDLRASAITAIAVLIVTCPCALGLAVPVAHVIAASRLFERGLLLRDGAALERLAEARCVVFDKTGTLTWGEGLASLLDPIDGRARSILAGLAAASAHPRARTLAETLKDAAPAALEAIADRPGLGIEARVEGRRVRLGRPEWASAIGAAPIEDHEGSAFAIEGGAPVRIAFEERLRPQARASVDALRRMGLDVEIVSGDAEGPVARLAERLGIERWTAGARPEAKLARLEALDRPLMVGDGLNDAPALAAAHASIAPSSAVDVGRQAADLVSTREGLDAVPAAIALARRCDRVVRGNIALALCYNAIAVPLAFAGWVTPLFAAIAMSASSLVVLAHSLRLARKERTS